MAFIDFHLAVTLIMVTVVQKVGVHYSLGRWLLCSTGLVRYLYPTDNELRTLAGVPKDKGKGKKDKKNVENGKQEKQTFHVPKNLQFELESANVSQEDVVFLHYYEDYRWLMDFSLYSLIVYICSEVYIFFFPNSTDPNLSMIWCFMVLRFAYKALFSLTLRYFQGEESIGERSTVIVTWFGYLIVAMAILIVDENVLETGLENAYTSFNNSAHAFLEHQGVNTKGPASKLILKFFLALWCATVGALFTFPGFRMARMHWDAVRYCKEKKLLNLGLNLSFTTPFLVVLLWLKPLSKQILTSKAFGGMDRPLLTEEGFDSLRFLIVVLAVCQRLVFMPTYLQAYLNLAHIRVLEMKKEAGRITNQDLQNKIAAVFYYLCVVALQYVTPLILCLYTLFMFKTLGGYSWNDFLKENLEASDECPASMPPPTFPPETSDSETSILETAKQFSVTLASLKQVLNRDVIRGVFGFATWWTLFTWFSSSALGLVYQSYFTQL